LTTLFATNAVPTVPAIDAPAAPKKNGWLPLLSVLFLISYGLMTMLIVEQGRTIESQRALIRELFRDSTELSAVKMKAQQERADSLSAKTQAPEIQYPSSQTPSSRTPSTQAPSTQHPSTQAPTSQAPSSQAGPQHGAQNQSATQKPAFRMPSKPEADLVDDCRTLITI
jgi:cytoskeletal protein RodZ